MSPHPDDIDPDILRAHAEELYTTVARLLDVIDFWRRFGYLQGADPGLPGSTTRRAKDLMQTLKRGGQR